MDEMRATFNSERQALERSQRDQLLELKNTIQHLRERLTEKQL
jgi:predicted 2-oxoglutarate/Fe(II)-dependent dioxygenase YbiX